MTAAEFRVGMLDEMRKMREAVDRLTAALAPMDAPEPAAEPLSLVCPHPDDARINFSGQAGEEWECRLCHFRFKEGE